MKTQVMYSYVSATSPSASRSIALRDPQALLYLVDLCREALKGFCLFRLSTLWLLLCVKVIAERRFNKSQREREKETLLCFSNRLCSFLTPPQKPHCSLLSLLALSLLFFFSAQQQTTNRSRRSSPLVFRIIIIARRLLWRSAQKGGARALLP